MRTAILGHSQIRSFEDYIVNRGIKEIISLCKPGAKFENFLNSITIRQLKEFNPELVVVVLGSNDIDHTRNAGQNKHQVIYLAINHFIDKIKSIGLNFTLRILEIEPRMNCRICPSEYNLIRKAVNRKLHRKLREEFVFTYNQGIHEDSIGSDGVHFNSRGKQALRNVILKIIREHSK